MQKAPEGGTRLRANALQRSVGKSRRIGAARGIQGTAALVSGGGEGLNRNVPNRAGEGARRAAKPEVVPCQSGVNTLFNAIPKGMRHTAVPEMMEAVATSHGRTTGARDDAAGGTVGCVGRDVVNAVDS